MYRLSSLGAYSVHIICTVVYISNALTANKIFLLNLRVPWGCLGFDGQYKSLSALATDNFERQFLFLGIFDMYRGLPNDRAISAYFSDALT